MTAKERILRQADKVFKLYGVNSITMDDIAKGLGMSKKTIYQYFPNKAALVMEVAELMIQREEEEYTVMEENSENAVEELANVIKHSISMFNTISPKLVFEIQKYYPTAWKLFEDHEVEFQTKKMHSNLKKGIEEGYFREDIDIEIVTKMRMSQIDAGFDVNVFPPEAFNLWEVQLQMFSLYMYGIVTEKGRSLLDKYLPQDIHRLRFRT